MYINILNVYVFIHSFIHLYTRAGWVHPLCVPPIDRQIEIDR